jgi:hypothetical protein
MHDVVRPKRLEQQELGAIPNVDELRRYFGGFKHARFHQPEVVYHCLLRIVQGRFLLRPDERGRLVALIAGVIARAKKNFPGVRLFADAWLSNHAHLLLQGAPEQIPSFVGFIEREISRRWGGIIGWDGNMFQTYQSTALPGAQSQCRAFKYVLAQSTKENLVDSPLRWPGAHCAKDLVQGLERRGTWFDGTGYGKALHRCQARKERRAPPARRDFEDDSTYRFDKLPALAKLCDEQYREHVVCLVREIEAEAEAERRRSGKRVLGRRQVFKMSREARSALPKLPWFEKRRRMICWADRRARETLDYLVRYWNFQRLFREASQRFREGDLTAPFPATAFRPPSFVQPDAAGG